MGRDQFLDRALPDGWFWEAADCGSIICRHKPSGATVVDANFLLKTIEPSKKASDIGSQPTSKQASGRKEKVARPIDRANANGAATCQPVGQTACPPIGKKTSWKINCPCRNYNGQPESCPYGVNCWFLHVGTKKTIKRREQRARAAQRKESAAQPPRASPNPSATVAAETGNQTPANTAVRVKRARSSSPDEQVHSSAPSADGQSNLRQPLRSSAHITADIDGGSTSAAMPAPCTCSHRHCRPSWNPNADSKNCGGHAVKFVRQSQPNS